MLHKVAGYLARYSSHALDAGQCDGSGHWHRGAHGSPRIDCHDGLVLARLREHTPHLCRLRRAHGRGNQARQLCLLCRAGRVCTIQLVNSMQRLLVCAGKLLRFSPEHMEHWIRCVGASVLVTV